VTWLIHLANSLILCSFLARDILWLRALSVMAGGCLITFYLTSPSPLMAAVGWNLVFIGINLVQIVRLIIERRPVQLSEAEGRLRQLLFLSLSPRDVRRLVGCGAWREHADGETLIRQGEALDRLMVVYAGRVGVYIDGQRVASLRAGRLVGELSWVTGAPASADVVATGAVRCLVWEREQLKAFLERHPVIRQALQVILGEDLARKLGRSTDATEEIGATSPGEE